MRMSDHVLIFFCDLLRQCSSFEYIAQEQCRGAQRAFLCPQVHMDESEIRIPAIFPLEITQQAPVQVADQRNSFVDSLTEPLERFPDVPAATIVVDHLPYGVTVFRHYERDAGIMLGKIFE